MQSCHPQMEVRGDVNEARSRVSIAMTICGDDGAVPIP